MEQIRLACGLSKEPVISKIMLYKDTKAMVHLPNGNNDFFDIITEVLQGDILPPFLFMICLDYIL